MSSFTDPLEVRKLPGRWWETTREMSYFSSLGAAGSFEAQAFTRTFTVPEGFVTDFASIPRPFWALIGHPAGEYVQAAVLHDFLYRLRSVRRSEADRLFLEAMEVLGVARWKRWAMWLAVRAGGWWAYAEGGR